MDDDYVEWDDDFSVDIPLMDEQHKKLVIMINDLFQRCVSGNASASLTFAMAVKDAADYARTHFQIEEAYLEKAAYPGLADQKREHESYLATILATVEKCKKGEAEPLDLVRFLKNWLLNHIAVKDKKYTSYLMNSN